MRQVRVHRNSNVLSYRSRPLGQPGAVYIAPRGVPADTPGNMHIIDGGALVSVASHLTAKPRRAKGQENHQGNGRLTLSEACLKLIHRVPGRRLQG